MECPAVRCMRQDLDCNTVIVYFTADDVIRFSPSDPKIVEKERLCVCVSVNAWADMGVGMSVPWLPLSLSPAVWE